MHYLIGIIRFIKHMNEQKSIKKNFLMNILLTLSGIIFPIISFPYVSRILGPEGTGKVDFASSIMGYFSLFAQLGIPTYGIRACARVRDNKLQLSRTVAELMMINLIMTLFSYIVFVPMLFLIPKFMELKELLIIFSTTLLLNTIGIEYLYRAIEQYTYITIRSIVFKILSFVFLFLLVKTENDYVIYGAITLFAASASNLMNFIHARKYLTYRNLGKLQLTRHLKPIALFFAMSCATTIYLPLDRVMLGFIGNDADVGYYGAAVKVKNIMLSLVTSLGAVLLPRASYYVEHGLMDEFVKITKKALHFVVVASVPISVFFILYAHESIMVVSGAEYLPAVPAMQAIIPTLIFVGITNILGIQILLPLGKEKYVLYSEIAGAVVDLILNMLLIPHYKATGAAIGTLAAEFVVLIVQLILFRKIKDKIDITDTFKQIKYYTIISAVIAGSIASVWIKFVSIPINTGYLLVNNLIPLAIAGLLFFGIYAIVMLIYKDEIVLLMLKTLMKPINKHLAQGQDRQSE